MTKRLLLSPGTENFFLSWYLPFKGPHSPTHLSGSPTPLAHWCHSGETQHTRTATSPFSTTSSSLRFYVQSTSHWQSNVKGKENPFVLSRVYDVDWICEYDMAWYPFDTQSCGMVFEVGGSIHNPQFWQILTNVSFSVKRKLRGVCPAGGVWLGVHRPQRSHPILYQVFINISTKDHLVGQLWKKKLHTKPKLFQEHQHGSWGE